MASSFDGSIDQEIDWDVFQLASFFLDASVVTATSGSHFAQVSQKVQAIFEWAVLDSSWPSQVLPG